MMTITRITNIDNKKHIALLDTSSISFMQGLEAKGISSDDILKDYDLLLIPEWVLVEVADCSARINPAGSQIDSAPNEVIGAVIRSVYGGCHFKTGMTVLKRIASAKGSQLTLQSISNSSRCF